MLKIKKSGFTIIELLVFVIIIGVLGYMILSKSKATRAGDRDYSRQQKINTIADKLEDYFNDNSGYPDGNFDSAKLGLSDANDLKSPNNNDIKKVFSTSTEEPKDAPNETDQFVYIAYGCAKEGAQDPVAATCTKYVLKSWMERAPELKKTSTQ